MRVLWFTWKDGDHPQAGGAEAVNEALARRLAADGHRVTFVVAGFRGASAHVERDGYAVRRVGNRWTVYLEAWRLYRRELRGTADVVIDEVNTVPFFARWYVGEPVVAFVHQLAREIWFHEMAFPLSLIGWLAEPLYLRALSGSRAVTVSESSRRDLARCGFDPARVAVMPQLPGLPAAAAPTSWEKPERPTMLAFGSARSMKRTLHAVRAFELMKGAVPDARLVIAGDLSSRYGRRVRSAAQRSRYAADIELSGRIPAERKAEVLGGAHILLATSVKEGWCLVASEAAGQGTPTVGYDVDGLRDSVVDGTTGVLVRSGDVRALADSAASLLGNGAMYERLRLQGWKRAAEMNEEISYRAFVHVLTSVAAS